MPTNLNRKRSPILRFISATLVVCFVAGEARFADAAPAAVLSPLERLLADPSVFQVASDHASIDEISKNGNGPLILHIQDAHANLSGQENLAAALDDAMSQYGIYLVLSEGGWGDCSLTLIKKIASKDVWKKVARRFLVTGKIQGEEYLNLVSDHPMKIIGVEDEALYDKSIEAYRGLTEKRERALERISRIQIALQKLKVKTYAEPLLRYEKSKKAGTGDASAEALLTLASEAGFSLSEYPQLSRLARLKEKEGGVHFDLANLEHAVLVEELSGRGVDISRLAAMEEDKKVNRLNQFAYFQNTFNIAKQKNLFLTNYVSLLAYFEYLKEFSAINLTDLLSEVSRAEDDLYFRLLADEDSRLIRSIDQFTGLLESAHHIQMTARQYAEFKLNEPDIPEDAMLAFLNRKLAERGYFDAWLPIDPVLSEGREALDEFYALVAQRDEVFIQNIKKAMTGGSPQSAIRNPQSRAAFLITGGYHTANLKRLMAENGYSYLVLTPAVERQTSQEKYESLLLSRGSAPKKKIHLSVGESSKEDKPLGALDADLAKLIRKKDNTLRMLLAARDGARLAEIRQAANPASVIEEFPGTKPAAGPLANYTPTLVSRTETLLVKLGTATRMASLSVVRSALTSTMSFFNWLTSSLTELKSSAINRISPLKSSMRAITSLLEKLLPSGMRTPPFVSIVYPGLGLVNFFSKDRLFPWASPSVLFGDLTFRKDPPSQVGKGPGARLADGGEKKNGKGRLDLTGFDNRQAPAKLLHFATGGYYNGFNDGELGFYLGHLGFQIVQFFGYPLQAVTESAKLASKIFQNRSKFSSLGEFRTSWGDALRHAGTLSNPFFSVNRESSQSTAARVLRSLEGVGGRLASDKETVRAVDLALTLDRRLGQGMFGTSYLVRTPGGKPARMKVAGGSMLEGAIGSAAPGHEDKVRESSEFNLAEFDIVTAGLIEDTGRVPRLLKIYGKKPDKGVTERARAILTEYTDGEPLIDAVRRGEITPEQLRDPSGEFWRMIGEFFENGVKIWDVAYDGIWVSSGRLILLDRGALRPLESGDTLESVKDEVENGVLYEILDHIGKSGMPASAARLAQKNAFATDLEWLANSFGDLEQNYSKIAAQTDFPDALRHGRAMERRYGEIVKFSSLILKKIPSGALADIVRSYLKDVETRHLRLLVLHAGSIRMKSQGNSRRDNALTAMTGEIFSRAEPDPALKQDIDRVKEAVEKREALSVKLDGIESQIEAIRDSADAGDTQRALLERRWSQAENRLRAHEEDSISANRQQIIFHASEFGAAVPIFSRRLYAELFFKADSGSAEAGMVTAVVARLLTGRSGEEGARLAADPEVVKYVAGDIAEKLRSDGGLEPSPAAFGRGDITEELSRQADASRIVEKTLGDAATVSRRMFRQARRNTWIARSFAALALAFLGAGGIYQVLQKAFRSPDSSLSNADKAKGLRSAPAAKKPPTVLLGAFDDATAGIPRPSKDEIVRRNKEAKSALETDRAKLTALDARQQEVAAAFNRGSDESKGLATTFQDLNENKLPQNSVQRLNPALPALWFEVEAVERPAAEERKEKKLEKAPNFTSKVSGNKVGVGEPSLGFDFWVANSDAGRNLSVSSFYRVDPIGGLLIPAEPDAVNWPLEGDQTATAHVETEVSILPGGTLLPIPSHMTVVSVYSENENKSASIVYDRANRAWYLSGSGLGKVRIGVRAEKPEEVLPIRGLEIQGGDRWKQSLPPDVRDAVEKAKSLPVKQRVELVRRIVRLFYYTVNPLVGQRIAQESDFIRAAFRDLALDCDGIALIQTLLYSELGIPGEIQDGFPNNGSGMFYSWSPTGSATHMWTLKADGIEEPVALMEKASPLYHKQASDADYRKELAYIEQRAAFLKAQQMKRLTEMAEIEAERAQLAESVRQRAAQATVSPERAFETAEREYYAALGQRFAEQVDTIDFALLSADQSRRLLNDLTSQWSGTSFSDRLRLMATAYFIFGTLQRLDAHAPALRDDAEVFRRKVFDDVRRIAGQKNWPLLEPLEVPGDLVLPRPANHASPYRQNDLLPAGSAADGSTVWTDTMTGRKVRSKTNDINDYSQGVVVEIGEKPAASSDIDVWLATATQNGETLTRRITSGGYGGRQNPWDHVDQTSLSLRPGFYAPFDIFLDDKINAASGFPAEPYDAVLIRSGRYGERIFIVQKNGTYYLFSPALSSPIVYQNFPSYNGLTDQGFQFSENGRWMTLVSDKDNKWLVAGTLPGGSIALGDNVADATNFRIVGDEWIVAVKYRDGTSGFVGPYADEIGLSGQRFSSVNISGTSPYGKFIGTVQVGRGDWRFVGKEAEDTGAGELHFTNASPKFVTNGPHWMTVVTTVPPTNNILVGSAHPLLPAPGRVRQAKVFGILPSGEWLGWVEYSSGGSEFVGPLAEKARNISFQGLNESVDIRIASDGQWMGRFIGPNGKQYLAGPAVGQNALGPFDVGPNFYLFTGGRYLVDIGRQAAGTNVRRFSGPVAQAAGIEDANDLLPAGVIVGELPNGAIHVDHFTTSWNQDFLGRVEGLYRLGYPESSSHIRADRLDVQWRHFDDLIREGQIGFASVQLEEMLRKMESGFETNYFDSHETVQIIERRLDVIAQADPTFLRILLRFLANSESRHLILEILARLPMRQRAELLQDDYLTGRWSDIVGQVANDLKRSLGMEQDGNPSVDLPTDQATADRLNQLAQPYWTPAEKEYAERMRRLSEVQASLPGAPALPAAQTSLNDFFTFLRNRIGTDQVYFDVEYFKSTRRNPVYLLSRLLAADSEKMKIDWKPGDDEKPLGEERKQKWNEVNDKLNQILGNSYSGGEGFPEAWHELWTEYLNDFPALLATILLLYSLLGYRVSERLRMKDRGIVGPSADRIIDDIFSKNPWLTGRRAERARVLIEELLSSPSDEGAVASKAFASSLSGRERVVYEMILSLAYDPPEKARRRFSERLYHLVPFGVLWDTREHKLRQAMNREIGMLATTISADAPAEAEIIRRTLESILKSYSSPAEVSGNGEDLSLQPQTIRIRLGEQLKSGEALSVPEAPVNNRLPNGSPSGRRGSGSDFYGFRPAVSGDAASQIDARKSLALDKLVVREHADEAMRSSAVVIDMASLLSPASSDTAVRNLARSIRVYFDKSLQRTSGHNRTLTELLFVRPDGTVQKVANNAGFRTVQSVLNAVYLQLDAAAAGFSGKNDLGRRLLFYDELENRRYLDRLAVAGEDAALWQKTAAAVQQETMKAKEVFLIGTQDASVIGAFEMRSIGVLEWRDNRAVPVRTGIAGSRLAKRGRTRRNFMTSAALGAAGLVVERTFSQALAQRPTNAQLMSRLVWRRNLLDANSLVDAASRDAVLKRQLILFLIRERAAAAARQDAVTGQFLADVWARISSQTDSTLVSQLAGIAREELDDDVRLEALRLMTQVLNNPVQLERFRAGDWRTLLPLVIDARLGAAAESVVRLLPNDESPALVLTEMVTQKRLAEVRQDNESVANWETVSRRFESQEALQALLRSNQFWLQGEGLTRWMRRSYPAEGILTFLTRALHHPVLAPDAITLLNMILDSGIGENLFIRTPEMLPTLLERASQGSTQWQAAAGRALAFIARPDLRGAFLAIVARTQPNNFIGIGAEQLWNGAAILENDRAIIRLIVQRLSALNGLEQLPYSPSAARSLFRLFADPQIGNAALRVFFSTSLNPPAVMPVFVHLTHQASSRPEAIYRTLLDSFVTALGPDALIYIFKNETDYLSRMEALARLNRQPIPPDRMPIWRADAGLIAALDEAAGDPAMRANASAFLQKLRSGARLADSGSSAWKTIRDLKNRSVLESDARVGGWIHGATIFFVAAAWVGVVYAFYPILAFQVSQGLWAGAAYLVISLFVLPMQWPGTIYRMILAALVATQSDDKVRREPLPDLPDAELPPVSILIPTRNEPASLVIPLLQSTLDANYPSTEILLVDNSDLLLTDETGRTRWNEDFAQIAQFVRAHSDRIRLVRRDKGEPVYMRSDAPSIFAGYRIEGDRAGGKAGNLNLGIRVSDPRSSWFFELDADSTLPADSIRKMVSLGETKRKEGHRVGFVQSRFESANPDQNILTRAQSVVDAVHYRLFFPYRTTAGAVPNWGHGVLMAREAVNLTGGIPEVLSEDLAWAVRLGLQARHENYSVTFPTGEMKPDNWTAFKIQRNRWAKGTTLEALQNLIPVWRSKNFTLPEKLDLTFEMTSYAREAIGVLMPAFFMLSGVLGKDQSTYFSVMAPAFYLTFFTDHLLLGFLIAREWLGGRRGSANTLIAAVPAVSIFLNGIVSQSFFGVVEALFGANRDWNTTPKLIRENATIGRQILRNKFSYLLAAINGFIAFQASWWFFPLLILSPIAYFFAPIGNSLYHRLRPGELKPQSWLAAEESPTGRNERLGARLALKDPRLNRRQFMTSAAVSATAALLGVNGVPLLAQRGARPADLTGLGRFLSTLNVNADGMPLSYKVPAGFWRSIGSNPTNIDDTLERLLTTNSLNIYDGGALQIALTILGAGQPVADGLTQRLLSGRSGNLQNIRGAEGFQYGDRRVVLSRSNGLFFRMISSRYLQNDPLDNKASLPGFPTNAQLHHEDWKPILGENVWATLLGPLQRAWLQTGGKVDLNSPAGQLALSMLPALRAMRNDATGGFYHVPHGVSPDKNPFEISAENNASLYAGLNLLRQVAQQSGRADLVRELTGWMDGIERFLKDFAFDKANGVFYQGGSMETGRFVPSRDFAVDVQTWTVSALGVAKIDSWFGAGTSYSIWQKTKDRAAFLDNNRLAGVGFTDGHDVLSSEWTFGAILMVEEMVLAYAGQATRVTSLTADAAAMRQGVARLRVALPDGSVSYNYTNKRVIIPWGWKGNAIPSLAGANWAIFDAYGFNPLIPGGGRRFTGRPLAAARLARAKERVALLRRQLEIERRRTARLSVRLEAAREEIERLRQENATDALTGMLNRKRYQEMFGPLVRQAQESGIPLSIVLIDLDRFKEVNEQNGYRMGDEVLKYASRVIRAAAGRWSDIVYPVLRLGGEEFVILLPGTEAHSAAAVAETIRRAFVARLDLRESSEDQDRLLVRSLPLKGTDQYGETDDRPITASFGVAELQASETAEAFFDRANEALKKAKETRNAVVVTSAARLSTQKLNRRQAITYGGSAALSVLASYFGHKTGQRSAQSTLPESRLKTPSLTPRQKEILDVAEGKIQPPQEWGNGQPKDNLRTRFFKWHRYRLDTLRLSLDIERELHPDDSDGQIADRLDFLDRFAAFIWQIENPLDLPVQLRGPAYGRFQMEDRAAFDVIHSALRARDDDERKKILAQFSKHNLDNIIGEVARLAPIIRRSGKKEISRRGLLNLKEKFIDSETAQYLAWRLYVMSRSRVGSGADAGRERLPESMEEAVSFYLERYNVAYELSLDKVLRGDTDAYQNVHRGLSTRVKARLIAEKTWAVHSASFEQIFKDPSTYLKIYQEQEAAQGEIEKIWGNMTRALRQIRPLHWALESAKKTRLDRGRRYALKGALPELKSARAKITGLRNGKTDFKAIFGRDILDELEKRIGDYEQAVTRMVEKAGPGARLATPAGQPLIFSEPIREDAKSSWNWSWLERHVDSQWAQKDLFMQKMVDSARAVSPVGQPELRIAIFGSSTGEEIARTLHETISWLEAHGEKVAFESGDTGWRILITAIEKNEASADRAKENFKGSQPFRRRQNETYATAVLNTLKRFDRSMLDRAVQINPEGIDDILAPKLLNGIPKPQMLISNYVFYQIDRGIVNLQASLDREWHDVWFMGEDFSSPSLQWSNHHRTKNPYIVEPLPNAFEKAAVVGAGARLASQSPSGYLMRAPAQELAVPVLPLGARLREARLAPMKVEVNLPKAPVEMPAGASFFEDTTRYSAQLGVRLVANTAVDPMSLEQVMSDSDTIGLIAGAVQRIPASQKFNLLASGARLTMTFSVAAPTTAGAVMMTVYGAGLPGGIAEQDITDATHSARQKTADRIFSRPMDVGAIQELPLQSDGRLLDQQSRKALRSLQALLALPATVVNTRAHVVHIYDGEDLKINESNLALIGSQLSELERLIRSDRFGSSSFAVAAFVIQGQLGVYGRKPVVPADRPIRFQFVTTANGDIRQKFGARLTVLGYSVSERNAILAGGFGVTVADGIFEGDKVASFLSIHTTGEILARTLKGQWTHLGQLVISYLHDMIQYLKIGGVEPDAPKNWIESAENLHEFNPDFKFYAKLGLALVKVQIDRILDAFRGARLAVGSAA